MVRFLFAIIFMFSGLTARAQYSVVWLQSECDTPVTGYSRLEDIVVTDHGQVFVTGTIDTALGVGPAYISYDSLGQLLWKKSVSNLNLNFSYRLVETPSGNLIFGGEYEDNTGTNNMLYNELDDQGNITAGVIYNTPGTNTGDDLEDICVNTSGSVYMSGQIQSASNFYAAVIRYDNGGVFRWMSFHPLLPGWISAVGRSVEATGDTGVYQLIFNFSGFASLAYCDSSGNYQWQTTLPLSIPEYHTQLIIDKDGNAIVGGDIGSTGGIVKINGAGDTIWTAPVSYPGLSGLLTTVIGLKTDSSGNIYALATNGGNPAYSLIAAFDASGNQLWADTLRGLFTIYSRNKEFFHLEENILTITTNRGTSWLYRFTTGGQRITDNPLVLPGISNPEVSAMDYFNGDLFLTGTGAAGFNIRQGYTARLTGLTTGINDIVVIPSLPVYPNPASDIIRFEVNNPGTFQMNIYDLTGRCVLEEFLTSHAAEVNISDLPEGMYLARLLSDTYPLSGKFIVKRN